MIEKIEGAHRTEKNKSGNIIQIVTKLTDWNYFKEMKTMFINAAIDGNDPVPVIVLQIYSPVLTTSWNEAMRKWKELKEERQAIQENVK